MDFGIPRNSYVFFPTCRNSKERQEFLGIRGVNFHGKFGLGLPRNSKELLTVTTLVLKTYKFPKIPS